MRRGGKLEDRPCHLVDLMATCVDVAKADYPTERDGERIQPLEGVSLQPLFRGERFERKQPIFWEHEGNRAIRDGKWKLVAKENKPWELYDMQADRTEMHDLAGDQPQRVNELTAKWDAWAKRASVLPLGGWRAKPKKTSFNKKQKVFELKPGADLPRDKAPFVEARALHVTASVDKMADGVLVAQGGTADGYSLHLKDGKLCFATRHNGELNVVTSDVDVPAAGGEISLRLNQDGTVTMSVGDRRLASGKVPGPMARMPIDGLQVGRDTGGAVGEYSTEFPFQGRITLVTVRVGK